MVFWVHLINRSLVYVCRMTPLWFRDHFQKPKANSQRNRTSGRKKRKNKLGGSRWIVRFERMPFLSLCGTGYTLITFVFLLWLSAFFFESIFKPPDLAEESKKEVAQSCNRSFVQDSSQIYLTLYSSFFHCTLSVQKPRPSLVLTLMCGIHSRSALGSKSSFFFRHRLFSISFDWVNAFWKEQERKNRLHSKMALGVV